MRSISLLLVLVVAGLLGGIRPGHADAPVGQDFLADAKSLLVVGACAEGTSPQVAASEYAAHCKKVRAAQEAYKKTWLAGARAFFAANVPKTIPKVVVYPFAGGDLSTALTVFPDADEITTLSLEPAGDPLALARVERTPNGRDGRDGRDRRAGTRQLKSALVPVATELSSLYRANYSVTMNMISAMRAGALPTQLIFSLSALSIHGYELLAVRYFQLTPDGDIRYLTPADITALDAITDIGKRNRELGNVELRFRKIGRARDQIYRHIMANLDDAHLAATPGPLRHLEKKGHVAAMTKAASYLLTFNTFHTMRKYVIDHVDWMVSDSTGLPPAQGKAAGFEYETWGRFETSNMPAGGGVAPAWKAMFAAQPRRPLAFRFGYPDGKYRGHLIIMRRGATP